MLARLGADQGSQLVREFQRWGVQVYSSSMGGADTGGLMAFIGLPGADMKVIKINTIWPCV